MEFAIQWLRQLPDLSIDELELLELIWEIERVFDIQVPDPVYLSVEPALAA